MLFHQTEASLTASLPALLWYWSSRCLRIFSIFSPWGVVGRSICKLNGRWLNSGVVSLLVKHIPVWSEIMLSTSFSRRNVLSPCPGCDEFDLVCGCVWSGRQGFDWHSQKSFSCSFFLSRACILCLEVLSFPLTSRNRQTLNFTYT